MLKFRLSISAFLLALALCISTERRAYAYIDPGSGLLILQNIGAAVTGLLFFFRRRIKALFVRKTDKDSQQSELPTHRES